MVACRSCTWTLFSTAKYPYASVEPQQSIYEENPKASSLRGPAREAALASARMDFAHPDAAPSEKLNRILWHAAKGWNVPYPGVKQALFYVLLGAHMPAILVETGFISNPAEEGRLRSAGFQESAAEAISRGVKDFVDARRRLASAP